MTYELAFKKLALKEWKKLAPDIREQFRKKLKERLKSPMAEGSKLSGGDQMYKIKLRNLGYPLVYKVEKKKITVTVLAVGKRERNEVYFRALNRL
jgi:mRNA interferase RelE/StbE